MKRVLFFYFFAIVVLAQAQPPYNGTIYLDPDIITSSDPSCIESTTYTGQAMITMYDRRVNKWESVNAYLFNVVWSDGITSRAQVNPEFGSVEAATIEAEKYAFLIGQLPSVLRKDVNEIWIHKGTNPFGGGNKSILIHTGQTVVYENSGILEETLIHEACHTSLDAKHATSIGWKNAQSLDGEFISTYAKQNPTREDIAESFLPWLAVRYRRNKISSVNYTKITQTIPNRLDYFDAQNFDLFPMEASAPVQAIKDGLYYIKGNLSQKFWTVKDAASGVNTQIVINDSLGTDNQKFYITSVENDYYITPKYNNKALGMEDAGTDNGALLVLLDSSGVSNQRFSVESVGNGYYWMGNNNSNIYLATPGTENVNGTNVLQWQFYNTYNFQWKFIPVEDATKLNNVTTADNLKVFPNPSNGHVAIIKDDNTPLELNVRTMEGKLVGRHSITSPRTELNLTNTLQNGLYIFGFINLRTKTSVVKKVIIQ